MKVTALLPDDLIARVKKLSKGANTTDALIKALREWISIKELTGVTSELKKKPLQFASPDMAERIRGLNRRS